MSQIWVVERYDGVASAWVYQTVGPKRHDAEYIIKLYKGMDSPIPRRVAKYVRDESSDQGSGDAE